ncbi:hypothetical protein F0344_27855 [Streptomyces finlayi]|uniref:Uncharacterized protein n=1 Tax=Streptomyces finlayi TaxID=67296 RepID=A0A7G7BRD9_9ACTN|nr:hypothetical protein [Streptomyces finlayi]QNE77904.1 hypothetical protein F0344_27855 [Streptomyces finlayi]
MGWTVLYIAFGIVALWLLGEVLLQYKARLRWRLLAFGGFLGVVIGVLIPSVLVIALGAIAFATGQTYVTLSFRQGFSTGWAIGGSPGESRRRRGRAERPETREPVLQVSDLEYTAEPEGPAAVYAPEPLPDDTGQYGVYSESAYAATGGGGSRTEQGEAQYDAYAPYPDHHQPVQDAFTGQDGYATQGTPGQDTHAGQYDYGTGRQSYAAYSDPYIGTGTTGGSAPYGSYDSYGNGYDSYGGQQQYAEPSPQQYGETPPGGVWVPHQREGDQYPPMPQQEPEEPAPYGNGYDTGQNDPYRY